MNQILANIVFFAGFILAVLGTGGDIKSSLDFIFFGLTEKNKLTRDKFGYFDARKNLILSGVFLSFIAVGGFYGVFAGEPFVAMFAGVMALIPAGLRGKAYFDNEKAKKVGRAMQIEFLRKLKSYASFEKPETEIKVLFNPLLINLSGGRTSYVLFGWIYSDNPNKSQAIDEIQNRLAELSLKDESNWFPK